MCPRKYNKRKNGRKSWPVNNFYEGKKWARSNNSIWARRVMMQLNMKSNMVTLKFLKLGHYHMGFWIWMKYLEEAEKTLSGSWWERLGSRVEHLRSCEVQRSSGWSCQYKLGCLSSAFSPFQPGTIQKQQGKWKTETETSLSAKLRDKTRKYLQRLLRSPVHAEAKEEGAKENKGEQSYQHISRSKGRGEYIHI